MRCRDRPYRSYRAVFVLTGVSSATIARMREAVQTVALDPRFPAARTRWPATALPWRRRLLTTGEIPAAAVRGFHAVPGNLSERELIVAANRRGFSGLPFAVTCSGNSVAINVAHGVFDGVGAIELVQALLNAACGEPYPLDLRVPLRFPLLRALKRVNRRSLTQFNSSRLSRRSIATPLPEPSAADLRGDTASYVGFTLSSGTVDQIKRMRESVTQRGRASLNSRLTSVALAALAAVYVGSGDVPVTIPVDQRAVVGMQRVVGNFIAVVPLGGLLSDDWSPSAISAQLAALIGSGAPVVTMALTVLRPYRDLIATLRGRRGAQRKAEVSVSLLSSKHDFPAAIWQQETGGTFGCATIGAWPSATFVMVTRLGSVTRMSVWDESGMFRLGDFQHSFLAEVERRTPAAPSS